MSWFDASANQTEATKAHVRMFLAWDFNFPSAHARFWSGVGDIIINGDTYVGAGKALEVSYPNEASNLTTERKTFRLSGVDPSIVSESDIDNSFGRDVIEYFGFLNTDTRTLIDVPEVNWEGRIDSFRRIDGDEPAIECNAEHRVVILDRTDGWRYTHDHQQQFFAGDNGFNLIGVIETKEVIWGGKRTLVGVTNHGGRFGEYTYGD